MSDEVSTKDMMKRIMEAVEGVQGRQAHIEMRAMKENMLPHEALRQYDTALHAFETTSDPSWPLRRIRDNNLAYYRALSVKYAGMMEEKEKRCLCEVVLFEAMKRYVTQADEWSRAKYKYIVALAEKQEEQEEKLAYFSDCLWV